ncbi:hypothetical protein IE53DRAFT_7871 [Violaceomyces palustris]|uniref:Uncharacterized protein n=1 Tax=Violaceomyces palustris TaxID=1673888 RepID=A0ACD0P2E1_9BASI|nr:hypothetical protein IE53DRAFT_7871 [Violaceomyces palustris]
MTQASSFLLSLLSFTILGLALLGHHAHALPSSSNPLGSPAGSGRFRVGGLGALSHRPFVQNRKRATVCNGDASLCSRLYSNVTYIGAHNSYAIGSTRLVTVNQEQSVTTQLNDGIRMLQAQAHKSTNSTPTGAGIDLCHSE